ncbi:MAG: LysR family transcriptional regulator [Pseudomonadales bacterium]|nr:LysR family transcriptional regulator [Pseudomonadales bacterium]
MTDIKVESLTRVRAFVQVVEEGSFAGAARALGVSRPALTRYVAQLEAELGAQLLQRSTRRVNLTGTGRAFYPAAQQLLDAADAAAAVVAERVAPFTGRLRVNAPMTFGTLHLAAAAAAFLRGNPGVELEMVLNDRFVDVIAEGFDLSVRIAEPEYTTSLVTRPLLPAERVVCAAPDYLAAAPPLERPADLARHRVLCYGYLSVGPHWRLLGPDGPETVTVAGPLWSNNGEVLRHAALGGLGIVQLPTFIVGPDLAEGRLVPVLAGWRVPAVTIHALYPRHPYLNPCVTAFVDFLAEWFLAHPPGGGAGPP